MGRVEKNVKTVILCLGQICAVHSRKVQLLPPHRKKKRLQTFVEPPSKITAFNAKKIVGVAWL